MEMSALRLSFVLVVILVVGSEAMNYLAFPRMGRSGYIAFPRMGRSDQQTTDGGNSCCSVGLKTEWVEGVDGKELRNICQTGTTCCQGLKEEVGTKPDGVFYSMCLPDCKPQTVNKSILGKLKQLLQQQ